MSRRRSSSNRTRSTPVSVVIEDHLAVRAANVKSIKDDISLLRGSYREIIIGKEAGGPALAKCHGQLAISRLTAAHVARWETQRNINCGESARRRNRNALRQFLKYCIAESLLPDSIIDQFPALPKPQSTGREWLRPREVAFMLRVAEETLDDYRFFAVYTYLQTGMRAAELPALKTSSLNTQDGTLTVVGKGSGDGKTRILRVSRPFIDRWNEHIIRNRIPPGGHIFFCRRPLLCGGADHAWEWDVDFRRGASPQVFRHIFDDPDAAAEEGRGELMAAMIAERDAGRADIDEFPHCSISPVVLRRTFACIALIENDRDSRRGLSLLELQEAMGHTEIGVTRTYLSDVQAYLSRNRPSFDLMDALVQQTAPGV